MWSTTKACIIKSWVKYRNRIHSYFYLIFSIHSFPLKYLDFILDVVEASKQIWFLPRCFFSRLCCHLLEILGIARNFCWVLRKESFPGREQSFKGGAPGNEVKWCGHASLSSPRPIFWCSYCFPDFPGKTYKPSSEKVFFFFTVQ